jgi:cell shape-determining protein MreC
MKRFWYYGLLIAIALFVSSMAVLWRDNTASEDSNDLTSAASVVFLVFVVCGPGLLAKQVFGMLVPVEQYAKERRRLRAELKAVNAAHKEAEQAIKDIERLHNWYLGASKMMVHSYERAYNENASKPHDNPYTKKR